MEALKFNSLNKQSPLKLSLLLQKAYLGNWYESVRQDENWMRFRKKVDEEQFDMYIKWINLQFSRILYDKSAEALEEAKHLYSWLRVTNLRHDLEDGLRFLYLVEIIYETILRKEFGSKKLGCLKLHKIKNHDTCLNYLQNKVRLKCVGINALDLADGNLKMLTGLLFLLKHDFESRIFNNEFIEYSQSQLSNLRSSSGIFQEKRLSSKSYSHILESDENKKEPKQFSSVSDIDNSVIKSNRYPHVQHIIESMISDEPHKTVGERESESLSNVKLTLNKISSNDIRSDNNLAKKCSEHERVYVSHVQKIAKSVVDPSSHIVRVYNDTFDPIQKSQVNQILVEESLDRNIRYDTNDPNEPKNYPIENSTIYSSEKYLCSNETSQSNSNSQAKRNNKKLKNKLTDSSGIITQIIVESETEAIPVLPTETLTTNLQTQAENSQLETELFNFPIVSEIKTENLKEISEQNVPLKLNFPETYMIDHEFAQEINDDSGNEIDYSKETKELLSQYISNQDSLSDLSVEEIISNNLNLNEKLKDKIVKSIENVKDESERPAYFELDQKNSNHFTELIDSENFIVKNDIINDRLVNEYSYRDSANGVSNWSLNDSIVKKDNSGDTYNSKRSSLNVDNTDYCFNNSENSDSEVNNRSSFILDSSIKMVDDSDETKSSLSISEASQINYQENLISDLIQYDDLNDLVIEEDSSKDLSNETTFNDNENYMFKEDLIKDYTFTEKADDLYQIDKEFDMLHEGPLNKEAVFIEKLVDPEPVNEATLNEEAMTIEKIVDTEPVNEATLNEKAVTIKEIVDPELVNEATLNEEAMTIEKLVDPELINEEAVTIEEIVDPEPEILEEKSSNVNCDNESIPSNENYLIEQNVITDSYVNDYDFINTANNELDNILTVNTTDSKEHNDLYINPDEDFQNSTQTFNGEEMKSSMEKDKSDTSELQCEIINEQEEKNISSQSQLNDNLELTFEMINEENSSVNITHSDDDGSNINEKLANNPILFEIEEIIEKTENFADDHETKEADQIHELKGNEFNTLENIVLDQEIPKVEKEEIDGIKTNNHENVLSNISNTSEINKNEEIIPKDNKNIFGSGSNNSVATKLGRRNKRVRKRKPSYLEESNIECKNELPIEKTEQITEFTSNENEIKIEKTIVFENPEIDEIKPSISKTDSVLKFSDSVEKNINNLDAPELEQSKSDPSKEIQSIVSHIDFKKESQNHELSKSEEPVNLEVNASDITHSNTILPESVNKKSNRNFRKKKKTYATKVVSPVNKTNKMEDQKDTNVIVQLSEINTEMAEIKNEKELNNTESHSKIQIQTPLDNISSHIQADSKLTEDKVLSDIKDESEIKEATTTVNNETKLESKSQKSSKPKTIKGKSFFIYTKSLKLCNFYLKS